MRAPAPAARRRLITNRPDPGAQRHRETRSGVERSGIAVYAVRAWTIRTRSPKTLVFSDPSDAFGLTDVRPMFVMVRLTRHSAVDAMPADRCGVVHRGEVFGIARAASRESAHM